jgi:tetratricopeptide (TPR) repeat protein
VLNTVSDTIDAAEAALAVALAKRPYDAAACAAALEKQIELARTDAEAGEYFDLAELYDYLAEEYEHLGRADDALAAMREAIAHGWDGQPEGRSRLAEIMMRAGRIEEATALWAQVRADTPDDVWLYNVAGTEYAQAGDHAAALDWLTDGLTLALDTGDPERLVRQMSEFRAESLAALGREPDELQRRAEQFLAAHDAPGHRMTGTAGSDRLRHAWAWFPADQYQRALHLWPELTEPGGPAEGGREHPNYCRAMQTRLVQAADSGLTGIRIAPIRIDAYLAWCAENGAEPSEARAAYAARLAATHSAELLAWPPARNEACWCGSGRKYKKCCAAPTHPAG